MKLKDKIILITGASRGIGRAMALLFSQEGATVIVNYNESKELAESLVQEINTKSGEAIAVKCDVSSEAQVADMIETIHTKYGRLDVLVNNAGKILRPGDSQVDLETWNRTIEINLNSVWLVTKAAQSLLSKGATILNIASYVGQLSSQYVLPYGVAKAGVINLTKSYAKELAPDIRVNCISPGNIATDMATSAGEEYLKKTVENTPLKRLGTPEELAQAALFLVCDDSSFITGVNLDVDGGFMLVH